MIVIRLVCLFAGMLLIVLAGPIAPALDAVLKRPCPAPEKDSIYTEEDDILNNKTKWRIILTGYIIFGIITIFSLISVFTLNNKINTLYHSVQSMEEKLDSMEKP